MANRVSAKKRIRQTPHRTEVNRRRLSRVRTAIRKVEEAITSGDKEKASAAFREAQPNMMRGARRGMIHRNTVSRKLSRLSSRIKSM